MDAISRSGVRILSGWNMTDWTLTMTANGKFMIDSVTVKKRGVTRTLTCDVLFNFHEKTLNPKTFLGEQLRHLTLFDSISKVHI